MKLEAMEYLKKNSKYICISVCVFKPEHNINIQYLEVMGLLMKDEWNKKLVDNKDVSWLIQHKKESRAYTCRMSLIPVYTLYGDREAEEEDVFWRKFEIIGKGVDLRECIVIDDKIQKSFLWRPTPPCKRW